MFAFRVGLRAAGRAARFRSGPAPKFPQAPHFQPRRHISGPRYSRFGEKPRQGQQKQQQWSNFGPVYRLQYIWRTYQRPIIVVGVGGGAIYVYNLEEVPVTHRRRFNLISPENEKEILGGDSAYKMILQQYRNNILPADHPLTRQVAEVVERLLPTTGGLAGDDWRVHVIDDRGEKNAFVMPGGKVFVFTGILPICENENGLAAVLGHEIAHNVAHHAAERVSRSSFVFLAAVLFSLLFDVSGQFSNSVANLVLSLPNSRTQEAEADHIGLLMMAQACYDPRESLAFWGRMKAAEKNQPPEFLSTHPSHYNRADHIKQWLPQAQQVFADAGCGSTSRFATEFKQAVSPSRPGRGGQVRTQQPSPQRRDDDDDDFF